ncbi:haloacid dehalogenase-like hydrolase [Thermohalobacter berrensis]|uniref:PEP phosphonomutase n=1 Tax=Thermohalobacter berrensis TaxID=99594 RepID=A0A419T4F4_9FIRM|nr:haloacid dehalogenase-like hydrolase [Thermohalobacter berrensis]RKD32258.1 PEP phosphonomutase [Thermohalobacter berrensis]
MVKRILDVNTSDMIKMAKKDIIESIKAAEGRTIVSEVVGVFPPLFGDVSNVELVCAFGADIVLLNFYDVNEPQVLGLPIEKGEKVVEEVKKLTGRFVGINLEPVDPEADTVGERVKLTEGRIATPENVKKAIEHGVDMIVLTGNPKTGVTNKEIIKSIKSIRQEVGDEIIIIAGKMHGAGSSNELGSEIMDKDIALKFIEAGSDIILLPAPGTVPGITIEKTKEIIDAVHKKGALVMTTIGTSQEGADKQTIRTIALNSKMAGADMHHLGDAGYTGVAVPENIMTYSIAIRGKRHTYRRMARSINR